MYVRYPAAIAFVALGAIAVLSGLLDVTKGSNAAPELLLPGAVLVAIGAYELQRLPTPSAVTATGVYTMVVWGWVVAICTSAPIYLMAQATTRVDDALFESTAGFTTTAATTLVPEDLPRGILAFRALSQWTAGAAALLVAVVLVPTFTGGIERLIIGSRRQAMISPSLRGGIRNVSLLYGSLTAAVLVAYFAAGMGPFDAMTYSATTVSSGGFANHSESLAFFDSATVEWIATLTMFVSAVSAPALWWLLKRESPALVLNSREFRLYLASFVAATSALATWQWGWGGGTAIRRSALAVTSAMSTTGLVAAPLPSFDTGALVILLGLTGIGTMAVAIGGGFHYLRVLEAWGIARRELQYQVHPRSVRVVKLGRKQALSEESLNRTNGYVMLFVGFVTLGAFVVALSDPNLNIGYAISAAISAISTSGPVPAAEGVMIDPGEFHGAGRAALMVLMVLGRLSIYPVILAVGGLFVRLIHLRRTL